jgi:DNA-directed RNA polymerase subunit L
MKSESTKEFELETFKKLHHQLEENISKWSENQLNSYQLPHPLIGKISVKEMLFFTDYHIKHHQKAIRKALGK